MTGSPMKAGIGVIAVEYHVLNSAGEDCSGETLRASALSG
jgi:hypothetical protein